MIDGARQAGLSRTTLCRTVPELAEQVRLTMQPGDLVLLKASRSSGFERVAELLKAAF
jgi:UDP-N-acetylmuramyl pentapeptide synthase